MAGSKLGSLKRKLGMKGKYKTGSMIKRMNEIESEAKSEKEPVKKEREEIKHKNTSYACKTHGMKFKSQTAHKDHMKYHEAKHKTSGIKKTGKSFGRSNKLGGGGRFRQVEHAVSGKKGVYNPAGLAAFIGRKSLDKARFQKLAVKGRKNHA